MWREIARTPETAGGVNRRTHALEIANVGCLVQTTAERRAFGGGGSLSMALIFVPGVKVVESAYGAQLVSCWPIPIPIPDTEPPGCQHVYACSCPEPDDVQTVTPAPEWKQPAEPETAVVEPVLIADPEAPGPEVLQPPTAKRGRAAKS